MEKIHCSDDYTLEKQDGSFQVCAWNENKNWVEEGLQAIASLKGKVLEITHGICQNHSQEFLRKADINPLTKWDKAKQRVQTENEKKLISFIKPHERSRENIVE